MAQFRYDAEDFRKALVTLKSGGLILYPTDTVWGIGCDARNEDAVRRIYELKQRKDAKSMLVLVGSEGQLERIVDDIPEQAWMLLEAAVDPLTIIYDKPKGIAPGLLAEDGSLGIRITNENFSKALCERFGGPIVSTSANISGKPTPQIFANIAEEIKNGVDYVVEYRREDESKHSPSNIIKLSNSGIVKVIR